MQVQRTSYSLACGGCIVSPSGRKVGGREANEDKHRRGVLEGRVTLHLEVAPTNKFFGGVD